MCECVPAAGLIKAGAALEGTPRDHRRCIYSFLEVLVKNKIQAILWEARKSQWQRERINPRWVRSSHFLLVFKEESSSPCLAFTPPHWVIPTCTVPLFFVRKTKRKLKRQHSPVLLLCANLSPQLVAAASFCVVPASYTKVHLWNKSYLEHFRI